MLVTESKLRQIVKEEYEKMMKEGWSAYLSTKLGYSVPKDPEFYRMLSIVTDASKDPESISNFVKDLEAPLSRKIEDAIDKTIAENGVWSQPYQAVKKALIDAGKWSSGEKNSEMMKEAGYKKPKTPAYLKKFAAQDDDSEEDHSSDDGISGREGKYSTQTRHAPKSGTRVRGTRDTEN